MELIGICNVVHDRCYGVVGFVLPMLKLSIVAVMANSHMIIVVAVIIVLAECGASKGGKGHGQRQYADLLDVHFHYILTLEVFAS